MAGGFVDHGYLKEEMITPEFTRWLYTAVTRSSEELFLVNFSPELLTWLAVIYVIDLTGKIIENAFLTLYLL